MERHGYIKLQHIHTITVSFKTLVLCTLWLLVTCEHALSINIAEQLTPTIPRHCLFGIPSGTGEATRILTRDIYTLASNGRTKIADWVAYRLDASMLDSTGNARRNWMADPWLPDDETLEPDDYTGANHALQVDRGHQAPLANFKGTTSWAHTNYLSNITPQHAALNQQAWRLLEDAERRLAQKSGQSLAILTGPLFERVMPQLPNADEPHTIPSGYWKIIALPQAPASGKPIRVVAFILDQDTPRRGLKPSDAVTVDEVERRTGLDFFWTLPDTIENAIEQSIDQQLVNELLASAR